MWISWIQYNFSSNITKTCDFATFLDFLAFVTFTQNLTKIKVRPIFIGILHLQFFDFFSAQKGLGHLNSELRIHLLEVIKKPLRMVWCGDITWPSFCVKKSKKIEIDCEENRSKFDFVAFLAKNSILFRFYIKFQIQFSYL